MTIDQLTKTADIKKISDAGQTIYEKIKNRYEPQDNGKFLAINVSTEEVWSGNSSSEAVELARAKYPEEVFFVVKIGYSAAETLARLGSR